MDGEQLLRAAEEAFTAAGGDRMGWPDPHPDRQVDDAEYSRVTGPGKHRIIGVRTAAWVTALTGTGLAVAANPADPGAAWRDHPRLLTASAQATWLRPAVPGALPLLLCLDAAGEQRPPCLLVGAGEPAVELDVVPDCGRDACDSGSADLLGVVDRWVLDVVSGAFVRLTTPQGVVHGRGDGWSASGDIGRTDADALVAVARAGRSPHPVLRGRPRW